MLRLPGMLGLCMHQINYIFFFKKNGVVLNVLSISRKLTRVLEKIKNKKIENEVIV